MMQPGSQRLGLRATLRRSLRLPHDFDTLLCLERRPDSAASWLVVLQGMIRLTAAT